MRITNWPQWFKIDWIYIEDKIFEESLYEYEIRYREDLIDNLIDRISECKNSDKILMKEDLKLLIDMDDILILSSIETNDYIDSTDIAYWLHCNNILKLNRELW